MIRDVLPLSFAQMATKTKIGGRCRQVWQAASGVPCRVSAEDDVQDRGEEKENGDADRGEKQPFFNAALRSEDFSRSAECGTETCSSLLEENGRDEEDGEDNLNHREDQVPHSLQKVSPKPITVNPHVM